AVELGPTARASGGPGGERPGLSGNHGFCRPDEGVRVDVDRGTGRGVSEGGDAACESWLLPSRGGRAPRHPVPSMNEAVGTGGAPAVRVRSDHAEARSGRTSQIAAATSSGCETGERWPARNSVSLAIRSFGNHRWSPGSNMWSSTERTYAHGRSCQAARPEGVEKHAPWVGFCAAAGTA